MIILKTKRPMVNNYNPIIPNFRTYTIKKGLFIGFLLRERENTYS